MEVETTKKKSGGEGGKSRGGVRKGGSSLLYFFHEPRERRGAFAERAENERFREKATARIGSYFSEEGSEDRTGAM